MLLLPNYCILAHSSLFVLCCVFFLFDIQQELFESIIISHCSRVSIRTSVWRKKLWGLCYTLFLSVVFFLSPEFTRSSVNDVNCSVFFSFLSQLCFEWERKREASLGFLINEKATTFCREVCLCDLKIFKFQVDPSAEKTKKKSFSNWKSARKWPDGDENEPSENWIRRSNFFTVRIKKFLFERLCGVVHDLVH